MSRGQGVGREHVRAGVNACVVVIVSVAEGRSCVTDWLFAQYEWHDPSCNYIRGVLQKVSAAHLACALRARTSRPSFERVMDATRRFCPFAVCCTVTAASATPVVGRWMEPLYSRGLCCSNIASLSSVHAGTHRHRYVHHG